MTAPPLGTEPILVLVEPQDLVNIAAAIRIAKNFAVPYVRLVNPAVFDPYRIEGIAHNTVDQVDRVRLFDTLEDAIADCTYAIALTARERSAKRQMLRPREAALTVTARASDGPVALVFGREDAGLTNDELDRCHALATIATNPAHKSLNLGQAVAVMSYECWVAREGSDQPRKLPRRRAVAAKHEDLALMFLDWERTLCAVDFFKSRKAENVVRSIREIFYRADLDAREVKLLRAVALEVVNFLQRHDVPLDLPPALARPAGAPVPGEPEESE